MVHDKYVQLLDALFHEGKEYLELKKSILTLTVIEKASIFISTLAIGFILIILGMIALFYLSFMAANLIAPYVGGQWESFGIITIFMLLLMLLFFRLKRILIIRPLTRFLYTLLKDVKNNK